GRGHRPSCPCHRRVRMAHCSVPHTAQRDRRAALGKRGRNENLVSGRRNASEPAGHEDMIGPWSELYLYNPDTAYHSDRINSPRPFLDQVKSTLDRYMELERPKAIGRDFDAQWYRPFSTPIGLISDLITSLLILLTIYGSVLLFHPGFAEQQANPS